MGFLRDYHFGPYLYLYDSMLSGSAGHWRTEYLNHVINLHWPVEMKIDVYQSGNVEHVDFSWKDSSMSGWNTLPVNHGTGSRFSPDVILAGGYTADSRSELGVAAHEDIKYTIGTGREEDFSPSPDLGLQA